MQFEDYQSKAMETAIYPNRGSNILYPTLGLVGEAGEVAEHVKKAIRDDGGLISKDRRDKMILELGDVLWYVAVIAQELQIPLSTVAEKNLEKLARRQAENKLGGSGSDR